MTDLPSVDDVLGPEPAQTGQGAQGSAPQGLPSVDSLLDPEPQALPSVDDYGRPVPGSSPEMDHFIANSGLGRVLNAFGQGAAQGWGEGDLGMSSETQDALKKAGILPDVTKGQGGIVRSFNEAILRPAAAGVDAAMRAGSAALGAAQAGVAQIGTEAGVPGLGRDIAAMPEAFFGSPGGIGPHAPLDLPAAHDLGVIGQPESVWKGVADPVPAPEGAVAANVREAQAANENAAASVPYAHAPDALGPQPTEPAIQPYAVATEAPTDVHGVARAIAPDTFHEYDGLTQHQADLRQQIADAADKLRQDAEAQAPHAAEIADLEQRLQDTTPRLAKKYQARLDALTPERDAFLNDEFTQGALTRDTPEISALRQQLLETDYRMRDLAPDVSAAYREAASRMPAEAEPEAAASAEPTAEPQQVGAEPTPKPATPAQGELSPVANPGEPAKPAPATRPAPAQGELAPVENPGEPSKPAPAEPRVVPNIAADVSQKLQAAGRPAEEADAAAQVTEAMWRTRAAAFEGRKGTPEEMYAREAPEIQAGRETTRTRQPEMAQRGANGKIRLAEDGRSTITLMRTANASTFLHEMGHDWLERMMRDGVDTDAPQRMRDDAASVRKYLGLNDGDAIPTKAHEKFARSFERYFMEGRAPTAGLARVFEQFKGWLTTIYQTVAKLRAPITADIRDAFDRLLTNDPERASVVPETAAESAQGELPTGPAAPKPTPLFPKLPKEPTRLTAFLRKMGGVQDEGGDVAHMLGGSKYRPGLINKAGMSMDDAARTAWEHGYFPEFGDTRPSINDLRDALESDLKGEPRYSEHDAEALATYQEAVQHNAEVERLSHDHDIDTTGMTREQFFEALSEKLSFEKFIAEIQSMEDAHESEFSEFTSEAREWAEAHEETWDSDHFYGIEGPRTEQELEDAYRSENAARPAGQGASGVGEPVPAAGSTEPSEVGGGQGGRGAGDAGRAGEEAGAAAGESAGGNAGGSTAGSGGRAGGDRPEPEPKLASVDVKTEAPEFATKDDREVEKAANIRLDKINGGDDMDAALRQLAEQNGDFMDARYGTAAYQTQMEIKNTRILLRLATSELMEASKKAQSMDPAAIADMLVKEQRAALVFSRLSTLSADWAHAGHELNKVMEGWESVKAVTGMMSDDRELFQRSIAERIAAYAGMDNPEQAAKFASDLAKTGWQKTKDRTLSLFINNLISGPITHMAYMVGNATMSLYRAVPLTTMQAVSGAVRQAISDTPITDRVYIHEVMPQLYGMFKGARDGITPALRAMKTGVPELAGGAQAELDIMRNSRQQVLPGKAGYVLETPSRVVAGLHTFSYSMSYSQEIARLAARQAAADGLEGNAFNAEVARLTSSPTAEMMDAASSAGMRGTLMTRPKEGSFQQWLVKGTNDFFALKLAVPFMQIGTNILGEGIMDQTMLSMLSPEARLEAMGARGGAARDIRIGKIATGSMLGAASVGMAMEGMMTGGGPSDPNQRRLLQATGWQPYSLRVGGMYIPYRKFLGPLGPLMAASADMYEVGHSLSHEGLTQAATALTFGFSEVVADETWMSGISNLVEAVHDRGGKGEQYLRSLATSFIPFSVGLSQTARLVDPYQRRAQTLLDAVRNKIPFVSEGLQPQIGVWGQPIASHLMVSPSAAVDDPVVDRMSALGLGMTMPERRIVGIPLTDQQYNDYARISGRMAKMRLDALVGTPGFSSLPAGVQTKTITDTISHSRQAAAELIKMKNPQIIQQAVANKRNLLQNGKSK